MTLYMDAGEGWTDIGTVVDDGTTCEELPPHPRGMPDWPAWTRRFIRVRVSCDPGTYRLLFGRQHPRIARMHRAYRRRR